MEPSMSATHKKRNRPKRTTTPGSITPDLDLNFDPASRFLDEESELSPLQALFVQEFKKDFSYRKAAERAGYSKNTAKTISNTIVKKPILQRAIREAIKARARRVSLDADKVIQEYMRIAFSNPKNYFDETGRFKGIHNLSSDEAVCISEVVVTENTRTGNIRTTIKLHDKRGALDSLARHLGIMADSRIQVDWNEKKEVHINFDNLSTEELRVISNINRKEPLLLTMEDTLKNRKYAQQ